MALDKTPFIIKVHPKRSDIIADYHTKLVEVECSISYVVSFSETMEKEMTRQAIDAIKAEVQKWSGQFQIKRLKR